MSDLQAQHGQASAAEMPPTKSLIRFRGDAFVHRDLERGEELHIQVFDAAGELVSDGYGVIASLAFRDKRKAGEVVETHRVQTVEFS